MHMCIKLYIFCICCSSTIVFLEPYYKCIYIFNCLIFHYIKNTFYLTCEGLLGSFTFTFSYYKLSCREHVAHSSCAHGQEFLWVWACQNCPGARCTHFQLHSMYWLALLPTMSLFLHILYRILSEFKFSTSTHFRESTALKKKNHLTGNHIFLVLCQL